MFRKLLSLDQAKQRIEEHFNPQPLGTVDLPLMDTVGLVLARDITSSIDVPPFNRSTVDGYAVFAEDTFGADEDNPVTLKVRGSVNIGEIAELLVERGDAVEIVTGAPLPAGTNAAVMLENTSQKNERISIFKPVSKGENMMALGSDIQQGDTVLKQGVVLSSRELGVIAALGQDRVEVFRRPKVAILSTGAEIVEPGKSLPPGKIYDINTYALIAAVKESNGEVVSFGVVPEDDVNMLEAKLKEALDAADVVITSGGVSVGPKDLVPKIIDRLGKPGLVIHGVAIKPGKPVAVAIADGKLIVSLPGHPTSSLLVFTLLAQPILLKMSGRGRKLRNILKATTTDRFFSARGRRTFITVKVSQDSDGHWVASQASTGQSGAITTLANADGYVELAEDQQFIDVGEEVTVYLFKNSL